MKFLLDVCSSSRSLIESLSEAGHDVLPADTAAPRASDEVLLGLGFSQGRILITEDKDFGELAVLRRLPHGTIVRMVHLSVNDQVVAMRELLDQHGSALLGGTIITVTAGRIRVRFPGET